MNLDITFCSKIDCKNVKCERHQKAINYIYLENHPISIADFKKCEFWEDKTNEI